MEAQYWNLFLEKIRGVNVQVICRVWGIEWESNSSREASGDVMMNESRRTDKMFGGEKVNNQTNGWKVGDIGMKKRKSVGREGEIKAHTVNGWKRKVESGHATDVVWEVGNEQ